MPTPAEQTGRTRVAVVFGGRSSEHGVSCLTAADVIRALDPDRYEVLPVGIARDGRWVLESDDPHRFAIADGALPEVDADRATVALRPPHEGGLVLSEPGAVPRALGQVDVVLPLLHGPWGEDGTVQGLLEMAGVRYVGAGVLASSVGMDKEFMKLAFAAVGLPQLPYVVIRPRRWRQQADDVRREVAALGLPVFVKPARAGSSFGVSRVDHLDRLDAAVTAAQTHDPKVIVEVAAIGGREVECAVLQGLAGSPPEASVVGEIVIDPAAGHDFYGFEAKYVDGTAGLQIPADLSPEVAAQIRSWAVDAFESIACEGLARVDFFYLPDGSVVVNEINTMPGFTPTSMFPQLWAATGLAYPRLVDRLLQLALERDTGLR